MPDRALQRRYTVALSLRPTPYNRDMAPTHIHTPRTVALAALGCAILLAACGSSSKPNTAGAHHHAAKQAFAICMRAHGVPNFPDLGTIAAYHYIESVNQSAPAFASANKACARYGNPTAPVVYSAAEMRELVNLAHCMRAHGVTNFPDPLDNNEANHQQFTQTGINPRAPAFQHAATECGNPGMYAAGR